MTFQVGIHNEPMNVLIAGFQHETNTLDIAPDTGSRSAT